MTDINEYDDPEASYRRGFQQGAYAALEAVKQHPVDEVRQWVDIKLHQWRMHARPDDRNSLPPSP